MDPIIEQNPQEPPPKHHSLRETLVLSKSYFEGGNTRRLLDYLIHERFQSSVASRKSPLLMEMKTFHR